MYPNEQIKKQNNEFSQRNYLTLRVSPGSRYFLHWLNSNSVHLSSLLMTNLKRSATFILKLIALPNFIRQERLYELVLGTSLYTL